MLEGRLGGPQLRVLALAEGLRSLGIETSVALPIRDSAAYRKRLTEKGFSSYPLPFTHPRARLDPLVQARYLRELPAGIQALIDLIRSRGPDVIHVHGLHQIHGAVAARWTKTPLVWHLNDLVLPGWLVRRMRLPLLSMADALICVSYAVRTYVFGTPARQTKIRVVHDPPAHGDEAGAEDAPFSPCGHGDRLPRLLSIGNLNPLKGHLDLLEAMRSMKRPARLTIAGSPLSTHPALAARIREEANAPGLDGRVHLLGWRDDVSRLLRAADIYVHPSWSEACPLAVLEAMAAARPVVATAVGGVPELVRRNETGLLVPPRSPRALASALDALIDHPREARRMGYEGRKRVKRFFSLERCVRSHANIYRDVIERRIAPERRDEKRMP